MPLNYKKLWKLLIDRDLKRTEFAIGAGIGKNTLAKLGKNEKVSMEVLQKICNYLDCNIGDIVDYQKEEKEQ